MKKILFVATVASHINSFHLPDIKFFKDNGWETHVVVGSDPEIRGKKEVQNCDKFYILPHTRSPFSRSNLKSIKQLKKLILVEKYDIIYCHNPIGGVVARVAARNARKKFGTKVIYTCHGAHFFTGAPILNWVIYYPIEKFLSRYTDCIITMNDEDYTRIKEKFSKTNVEFLPGVGFGMNFKPVNAEEKLVLRTKLGYKKEDFILMFVGELSKRKNQSYLVDVLNILKFDMPDVKLILVGIGDAYDEINKKVNELGLIENIEFLGYRTDVQQLLNIADIYVAASLHEGLAINILEALGSGLPTVATRARGQSDLIKDGINGFVVDSGDLNAFKDKIIFLYKNPELIKKFSDEAYQSVEGYRISAVREVIENLYRKYM